MNAAGLKRDIAGYLAARAAGRLQRHYPDWARAVSAEYDAVDREGHALSWAAGSLMASYATPKAAAAWAYAAALAFGLAVMTAYQWSADESVLTFLIMALVAAALGAASPRNFLISGLGVGAVVAAVNLFGTVTGIRPSYETTRQTLLHSASWLVLLAPTLAAAAAGRRLRVRVQQ